MDESRIFLDALQRPNAAERVAFLDVACGEDVQFRADIEALLQAHESDPEFLERPAVVCDSTLDLPATTGGPDRPPAATAEEPGQVLAGRYQLVERIGQGGMGTVWLARQVEPVKRPVAVKLIRPGMDMQAVLTRFEAERQALALMDHPNIAKVLDAGSGPDSRPFFAMEFVDGKPITRDCDENNLSLDDRLGLFAQVCDAVHHAHQKGVIHRDLKPSNVLVSRADGRAVPKVIDFGVAKATGGQLTEGTLQTGLGTLIGTPEYMSPEQASLGAQDVDTRSDVYSLGVLLYELLAGAPPFARVGEAGAGLLDVLRTIREEEPPRPSTKRSRTTISSGTDPADAKDFSKALRRELDWVVMKALEKDRVRRYESAAAFGEDVRRYRAHLPLRACPPSAGYRLRKFARRNRWAVRAAVAAVALIAAAGTAVGIAWWETAAALADEKDARRGESEQRIKAEVELAAKNVLLARQDWEANRIDRATAVLADVPEVQRGPDWRYLDRMCRAEIARIPVVLDGNFQTVAYSPSGRYVAITDKRTLRLFDIPTRTAFRTIPIEPAATTWLAFSPDGQCVTVLALLSSSKPDPARPGILQLFSEPNRGEKPPSYFYSATWDVESGRLISNTHRTVPHGVGWAQSADGPFKAVIDRDVIRVHDLHSGAVRTFAHGHRSADQLFASSGGNYLLSAGPGEPIKVWETLTGRLVHTNAPRRIPSYSLDFYPDYLNADGTRLLRVQGVYTRYPNRTHVEIWDVPADRPQCSFDCDGVKSAGTFRFSPDGRTVAGKLDAAIVVWNADTGAEQFTLRGHSGRVQEIAFNGNGTRIASVADAGKDKEIRIWDVK